MYTDVYLEVVENEEQPSEVETPEHEIVESVEISVSDQPVQTVELLKIRGTL